MVILNLIWLVWFYICRKKIESPFESRPKIPRESPFESKPKLARTGSYNNKKTGENGEETVYVDYNPSSGVTFRENKNSDVQIVGKGYNDDQAALDSKSLNGINRKANDKRRLTKGETHFCILQFDVKTHFLFFILPFCWYNFCLITF